MSRIGKKKKEKNNTMAIFLKLVLQLGMKQIVEITNT